MIPDLNVGYGTTNPQKLIHLVENNVAIRLQDKRSSPDASTNIEFINGNSDIFSSSFNTDWRLSNSNSIFSIQSGYNNVINNVINFTNSGYVGIGTNNPQQKLHIIGNVKLDGNIDATSCTIGDINVNTLIYETSNLLITKANLIYSDGVNNSNYVASSSNIISKRISELTTDMINENLNADNKFIVNNKYNSDLTVNGNLIINSNLIIYGDRTRVDTVIQVYTAEKLGIINIDDNSPAIMVEQKSDYPYIFIASNQNTDVFNIANNGDVNIIGSYRKNNRDVIEDTSNYVGSTSNILIGHISDINNILVSNINRNDRNSSNYVLLTSNILLTHASLNDKNSSNYVLSINNILINNANLNDRNSSNYVLFANNNLITIINRYDKNSSNYVKSTRYTLINN